MKIQLRKTLRGPLEDIEITKGITAEALLAEYKDQVPHQVLACKINNKTEELTYVLDEPCKVEFVDMRIQAGNVIYQNSLSLIYIAAVNKVLGKVKVNIHNSLNRGFYTTIGTKEPLTEEQVEEISKAMTKMVEDDIPLVKEISTREQALKYLEEDGMYDKKRLLEESTDITSVKSYVLEGVRNFFYGLMAPSTGYIKLFELMKYKRGVLLRFPHPSNPEVIPQYKDEFRMYQAFSEQTKWDKILGVEYVADLNDKIRKGECRELIQISEALHEKKIAEIADMIKQEKKRIVLIAGPSSSGKTTFAQRLCIQLKVNGLNPLYMGTDDYFVEREQTPMDENGEPDFENLNAVDIDLFNSNMNDLLSGKTVDLPSFNFLTGQKEYGKRITSITSDQPIVIEGIHGLNEELTAYIPKEEKFKIYISPLTQLNIDSQNRISTTDERMLRRMVRDNLYRGKPADKTINEWPKVRRGEDKNIFPYSCEADILFNSYHAYEIAVLKKYAQPLLEAITPEQEEYSEAVRILNFIRYFEAIEDDSVIVNNSILREFIGGSVFVD